MTIPAAGKGGTLGDSIIGAGGCWVGPAANVGGPPAAKWIGAGTNASTANMTLAAAVTRPGARVSSDGELLQG